jgi:predicted RNA binding protein YcfA (HicA-like mRNA interferase family)
MSDGLPVLKAKEVIKILEKAGFYIHHQSGSHIQLKHKTKSQLRVTVPFHNNDLPKMVLYSILKQAEISLNEFNKLR